MTKSMDRHTGMKIQLNAKINGVIDNGNKYGGGGGATHTQQK